MKVKVLTMPWTYSLPIGRPSPVLVVGRNFIDTLVQNETYQVAQL